MCKAYGISDPGPNDNSSALAFAEKAISYFTPNKLMSWNALANPPVGNPTKSIAANNIMKIVERKKLEDRASRHKRESCLQSEFVISN